MKNTGKRVILRVLAGVAALIAAGCANAPGRHAADAAGVIPRQWTTAPPSTARIGEKWLEAFADPALTALVNTALSHNFDLKAAAARVDAARERTRVAGAGRWPQLALAAGYGRVDSGIKDAASGAFETQFTLSWELDVWGRIKASQQAAGRDADAAAADFQGARLSLAAGLLMGMAASLILTPVCYAVLGRA